MGQARHSCSARIVLTSRHSRWLRCGTASDRPFALTLRGYARSDGSFRRNQDLAESIYRRCDAPDPEDQKRALCALIPHLDGGWALIAEWPDGHVVAAVDRMRSIPLFWSRDADQLVLTDDAFGCVPQVSSPQLDDAAALEFILAGFVTGEATLVPGVHQVCPGTYVRWSPGRTFSSPETTRYYQFYPSEKSTDSEQELEVQLDEVLSSIVRDWTASLGNEQIVVPLSGGLDSRLVVTLLRAAGVDDVLCYTYGPRSSQEVQLSQRVAEELDFRWKYVPYDRDVWARWRASEQLREFERYCTRGVAKPHTQDFPAVMELVDDGSVDPRNAIFFPGHTGDMVAGSHVPADYRRIERGDFDYRDEILLSHYRNWPLRVAQFSSTPLSAIREKVYQQSEVPASAAIVSPVAAAEMWDAQARQALYIINSVRAYEFIGAEWRTLWDYPLMDLFLKVPLEYRFGQRLYVNVLRDRVFRRCAPALADLPIAGHRDWSSREGLNRPTSPYTALKRQGRSAGRWLWQSLRGRSTSVTAAARSRGWLNDPYERLAGEGLDPSSSTVADALGIAGGAERLPEDARQVLRPFMRHRPHEVSWFGLYSAISLLDLQARL